jgi:hypothetical protein
MNNIIVSQAKKSIVLGAALGLLWLPSFAQAFFSDTETSPQQQFQASELQLETSLTQPAIMIGTNQAAATTSLLVNTSAQSVSAVFDITVTGVTGDVAFCDNINLQAQNGGVTAQAVLPAFTTLEQTTFGAYELAVSFIDGNAVTAGQECVATLAVTAWQENMNKGAGYQDTIQYELIVTATELAVLRQAAPLVSGDTEDESASALPSQDAKPPSTDAAQSAGGGGDEPVGPPTTPVVAGDSDTLADPAADEGEESTNQLPKEPADETNEQPEAPSEPAATPEHEADTPTDPSAPDTGVEIDVPADDVAPTQTDESSSPEEGTEPESAEDTDEGTSQPPEPAPAQPVTKPDPEPVAPPKAASDDTDQDPATELEPAVIKDEAPNE